MQATAPSPTFPPASSLSLSLHTPSVIAFHASRGEISYGLTDALVMLASQRERIAVIVANNQFDPYAVARSAKQKHLNSQFILRHIEVARAETIHQVRRAVQRLASAPASVSVVFVIGLLEPFYDEGVKWTDAQRILDDCLAALKELTTHHVRVLITVEPEPVTTRKFLRAQLDETVDTVVQVAPPPELAAPTQKGVL